ncbi:MAG: hypothetical protein WKF92_02155 [Pyrinomonadaceae bacterium]
MNTEERVEKVEKRITHSETRTKLLEQAILQMKELVIRHEERLDDSAKLIQDSREDFDFKMNAMIQAQRENEAGIRELRGASEKEWEAIKELRRASEFQLNRIEILENK